MLDEVQRRVLWLAVRMVDAANHDRVPAPDLKVGGHQASSASMVTLLTTLYLAHLGPNDLVAVKPHASPVFHAIQYLIGNLDRSYLTRLRERGGLQAYPSRTKDPDDVHFSTGSVGLGCVAPLFAAVTRRYVDAHFGARPQSRFVATLGDAELDEGNVWEAIADSATRGLGNVMWVVDLNRQSLDRVVPGVRAAQLERMFEDNGWHVAEAKYGRALQLVFGRPGGDVLRHHIDAMSNEAYQSLFRLTGGDLREQFLQGADAPVRRLIADVPDDELGPLVQNLGGHDIGELLRCYREADEVTDRPSVVFAYTVKGWGLPIAGDPLNHAAMLTRGQIDALRQEVGLTPETEWDRPPEGSAAERLCRGAATRVGRDQAAPPRRSAHVATVPPASGFAVPRKPVSTQEAFGRILVSLARDEELGRRLVTSSPDVAVSTNLGGWINKVGVFAPEALQEWDASRLLRWREAPTGQHLELGISEMNLFMLLGQLGLAHELSGERLLPIGTVYDPFICRGLDALIYGVYSDARFVLVGTPSGVTLAPEGGAHQSTITPSIGLELPGLTLTEPAYAGALDWLLCDGLDRLSKPSAEGGGSLYLRLSTRSIDQAPFEERRAALGDAALREQVLNGGYRLTEPAHGHSAEVLLFASGAVLPEVLAAAAELEAEGVSVAVVDVTSLDRLYRGWRRRDRDAVAEARVTAGDPLGRLIPHAERGAAIVTVHDAASHAMAWLGSVFGQRVVSLGIDGFGESGSVQDLYEVHQLSAGSIVNAALLSLHR